eukprot:comp19288_c0_seq1/m.22120 comp19288_c0_seq1/g.22120  ORF comp19288_c0_seq1/g.22120 comp19288_c0_seq1/m.22120 type:complete len:507 (-) comp19288_c0_seq1:940-2460(-)
MSLTAHPPLMRRRRSNELRSALLAKHRDALLTRYIDEEWFEEMTRLPVAPSLIVTSAETPGEILRVAIEYLKTRYALAVKRKESGAGEDATDTTERPETPEELPHPHTTQGLRLVGKIYKKLEQVGFEKFKLEPKENAPAVEEETETDLYDSVGMAKAVMSCLDREIEVWKKEERHKQEHAPSYFGDIVVCADKGRRMSMEDKHVVISDLNACFGLEDEGYPYQAFFAVYDGHGGVEAAEYTRIHLHANIVRSEYFKTDIEKAMKEGFSKTDRDFLARAERDNVASGCTCIVSIVRGDRLHTAWLGDSQAMLCRRGEPVSGMCQPHKPDREDEKARIEGLGGVVVWHGAWRVNGVLSVARAIGDRQLKKYVVSDCDYSSTELGNGESFLCLACDGLWDVMEPRNVIDFVDKHAVEGKPSSEIAKALVKHALGLGSADNISVIVVFFKDRALAAVAAAASEEKDDLMDESDDSPAPNEEQPPAPAAAIGNAPRSPGPVPDIIETKAD